MRTGDPGTKARRRLAGPSYASAMRPGSLECARLCRDTMAPLHLQRCRHLRSSLAPDPHLKKRPTSAAHSEPALLHTLRVRFSRLQSYTAVGTILVSVNPYSYHNYEETYGEHVMEL